MCVYRINKFDSFNKNPQTVYIYVYFNTYFVAIVLTLKCFDINILFLNMMSFVN